MAASRLVSIVILAALLAGGAWSMRVLGPALFGSKADSIEKPLRSLFNPTDDPEISRRFRSFVDAFERGGFPQLWPLLNETWASEGSKDSPMARAGLMVMVWAASLPTIPADEQEMLVGALFHAVAGRESALREFVELTAILDRFAPRWRTSKAIREWYNTGLALRARFASDRPSSDSFEVLAAFERIFPIPVNQEKPPDLHEAPILEEASPNSSVSED